MPRASATLSSPRLTCASNAAARAGGRPSQAGVGGGKVGMTPASIGYLDAPRIDFGRSSPQGRQTDTAWGTEVAFRVSRRINDALSLTPYQSHRGGFPESRSKTHTRPLSLPSSPAAICSRYSGSANANAFGASELTLPRPKPIRLGRFGSPSGERRVGPGLRRYEASTSTVRRGDIGETTICKTCAIP